VNLINKISAALILLLVIYVFLDAIAFSPREWATKPLGRRRKGLIFVVLGIGLASFIGTLVFVDPAVMGRAQWSALDMASGTRDGTFPLSGGGGFGIVLIDLALAYLLIVFSLLAFCFSRSQKLLKVIGVIGCLLSIEALGRGEQSIKMMFFGLASTRGQGTITYGAAMYVLSLVMSALLLISMLDLLDD
jgi:hypothetical protein